MCALCALLQLSGEEFEVQLQDHSTPIVLDVFAVWCGKPKICLSIGRQSAEHDRSVNSSEQHILYST